MTSSSQLARRVVPSFYAVVSSFPRPFSCFLFLYDVYPLCFDSLPYILLHVNKLDCLYAPNFTFVVTFDRCDSNGIVRAEKTDRERLPYRRALIRGAVTRLPTRFPRHTTGEPDNKRIRQAGVAVRGKKINRGRDHENLDR